MRLKFIKNYLAKSSYLSICALLLVSFIPFSHLSAANTYPWPNGNMQDLSPLKFAYRNCTDFAAWKINESLGGSATNIKFSWSSLKFPGGVGHAYNWKAGAIASGYLADNNPAVGSIAWFDKSSSSSVGHVAVVTSVNPDGSANIEEYNQKGTGQYGTRNNIRANAYLHIADRIYNGSSYLVIRQGNQVAAKAGLTEPWVNLIGGVTDIQTSGTRIAVRDANGTLYAKDSIYAPWITEATGVTQYAIGS